MNKYTEKEQEIHWILWDYLYSLFLNNKDKFIERFNSVKTDKLDELVDDYNITLNHDQDIARCILCKYDDCITCPLNKLDNEECNVRNGTSLYSKTINGDIEAIKTIRDIFM